MSDFTSHPAAVYVTDTMADVRMVEGLAGLFRLTLLAPSSLAGRATTWWPPCLPEDAQMVFLPGGRRAFLLRAARWLARRRGDFKVAFVLDNLSAALAANLGRRIGGPPVVLQVGRPTMEYFASRAIEARPGARHLAKKLIVAALVGLNERAAGGIGTVSDYLARKAEQHNELVRSIPFYGVNVETFAPRWSKHDARRALGLPQDGAVVLYRSRIAPEKDPDTFLLAIARLRAGGRLITALYMGGEREIFAERAARLGVEVTARDASSRTELPMWYVAADVTVQSSHAEGLGISLLESLACGVPVVVTDVGGLPEVAKQGETGLIVPPHDVGALADAVQRLLDDPAQAARFGEAGRAWVANRYGADDAFRAWAELAERAARRDPR